MAVTLSEAELLKLVDALADGEWHSGEDLAALAGHLGLPEASALVTAERAWVTVSPANSPASSPKCPSGSMTRRSMSWSRRHLSTSSLSPNVHTIIRPVPYSGSTSSSASTVTS